MSLIGQVVNFRYEILEKTGEGNLFAVYRTRDKVMNRLAAVKVVNPPFSADAEFCSSLVARAQMLIPLAHPNVARVFEAEMAQDAVFVAEEHVRGINLKERIRRISPFTVASAVDVGCAVLQGLDYLHRSGIVHGGLRPERVLMGPEGEVKLTSAGLAFAYEGEERRTLALMRGVHYSAPEMFDGKGPDELCDIYAIGVILYEMLTGSLPFEAETPLAVAMKQARDAAPSPRILNAGIPRSLEAIILKALSKDPAARFQSAREMLAQMLALQESLRVGRPAPVPANESRVLQDEAEEAPVREESLWKSFGKAAALFAFVFIVVFGAFMLLVSSTPPDVTVPDVVGMKQEDAQARLSEAGLKLQVDREDYHEKYDSGTIYFSDPQAGRQVKKNSIVRVYVSKGSRTVRVPGVVGISQASAEESLKQAGIAIRTVGTDYSSSVAAGDVIRQTPRAGSRIEREGAAVDLVVSLGSNPDATLPQDEAASSEESTNQESSSSSSGGSYEPRKLRVRFALPDSITKNVRVQLVVKDDSGEWTALDEEHTGGDTVSTTITATGKRVEIKTYIDGKEVDKQYK